MAISKRLSKGASLTYQELDDNFDYLNIRANTADSNIAASSATIATLNSQVAALPQIATATSAATQTTFAITTRPIEILAGTAVTKSCAFSGIPEVLGHFSLPVGVMGVNSILGIESLWTFTNSVNNKILSIMVGGVIVYTSTYTTTTLSNPLVTLANRNSLTSQIDTATGVTYSIDFTKAQEVYLFGQRASTGDTLTLQYLRSLHYMGD